MAKRLLLWDVDGTLLNDGGVGREAFHLALESVLGRELPPLTVSFAGKTDQNIARELLTAHGISDDEFKDYSRKLLRVMAKETQGNAARIRRDGHLFPGVRDLVAKLAREDIIQTVITGNVAVNAVLKLDAFHLVKYFDMEVGGFGSDYENRADLVPHAVKRADRLRNGWFEDHDVWLIGDTPSDFAAAKANGVRCLLVATGPFKYDELADLGADAVFRNLSDMQAFYDLVMPPPEEDPKRNS